MSRTRWVVLVISLGLFGFSHPLVAQDSASEPKDPVVAKTYAIYFSGMGHFYSGEKWRGAALTGTSAVGLYQVIDELACSMAGDALGGVDMGCNDTKLLFWLAASVGSYVYSLIDADDSAERVNSRSRPLRATIQMDGDAVRVGLRVGL